MAKGNGLGDLLFVSGVDISGDVGSISRCAQPSTVLDVTAINASGHERILSHVDGAIEFNSFFNDATSQEHLTLRGKNSGNDRVVTYFRGSAIGNVMAGLTAKQIDYATQRGADGSLASDTQCLANNYGLDWGVQLTAGKRTDTTATNGSSHDNTAASANGLVGYLQVFSFSGTSVTVAVQESSDNGGGDAFAAVLTFTAATGVTSEVKRTASLTTAVERYLRAVTTGTFTSAVFAVGVSRHLNAI